MASSRKGKKKKKGEEGYTSGVQEDSPATGDDVKSST